MLLFQAGITKAMVDMGPAAEDLDPVVVHLILVGLAVEVVLTLVGLVVATLVGGLVAMAVTVLAALVEVDPVEVVAVLLSADQAILLPLHPRFSL